MPVKKISISLPEDLLKILDDLARERGVARSKIIAEILKNYLAGYKDEKPKEYRWKAKKPRTLKTQTPKGVRRRIRKR